ncbi:MAG: RNA polymerase sigma factor [Muribaculaceae bacterium]|nr:RNA polymerase sigma factor [Muribaculaceae bacterium]
MTEKANTTTQNKANLDNEDLVNRLRDPQTRRSAFGDMIRLYSDPLYRQIRRLVQSHEDANDLLQNTFMKAWQNIDNFRGDARLSTWLYKIAINESISHLERERKRQGISIDDQEGYLINLIEADKDVDGDELAKRLREAVATLPEKQRIVFNMKYYDDMKYEQMSEILGTSVGALKASYHLAVKKIEKIFSDDD